MGLCISEIEKRKVQRPTLTWQVWHMLTFQHVIVTSFTKRVPFQRWQYEGLAQKERLQKRRKTASVAVTQYVTLGGWGCLSVSFRRCLGLNYLSKWLRVWKQSTETWKCEQEHTQGSNNPWPDGDDQVNTEERLWGVAILMPPVSEKGYKSIAPCAISAL